MVRKRTSSQKNKNKQGVPPEVEGWGSFELVDLVSPAASKMLLSFLINRVGGVALSSQLGLPRSSLYAYLGRLGDGPRRDARKKMLDFSLARFPLETKAILRDSATRLNYQLGVSA